MVAGGREPPHFTAYPHHQYIHTVGALRCCDDGGCWKSRTRALGDGGNGPFDVIERLRAAVRAYQLDKPAADDQSLVAARAS